MTHAIPASLLERRVHVHLVGCGGNGSQMLTGLARLNHALVRTGHPAGLHVTAFDPDRVTEANVGRQLFFPGDRGRRKCSVLVHRINAAYEIDWKDVPQRWSANAVHHHLGGGLYSRENPDVVISCVDSAASRREIAREIEECFPRPEYWLDLGNRQKDGQVILGQPAGTRALSSTAARLPTVMDVFPELMDPSIPEDNRPSCSLAEALESQDLFINQHITTWALQLLWELFRTGKLTFHGAFINLADGAVRPLPIPSPTAAMAAKPKHRRAARG